MRWPKPRNAWGVSNRSGPNASRRSIAPAAGGVERQPRRDVEAVVANAKTADGTGLVVSSSRAILYASAGDDYATAAATAAQALRDEINRHR